MIVTVQGSINATVHDVQKTRHYVLHSVMLDSGTVRVGDTLTLLVDKVLSYVVSIKGWFLVLDRLVN